MALQDGHEAISAHTRPLTESVGALAHPKGPGHEHLLVSFAGVGHVGRYMQPHEELSPPYPTTGWGFVGVYILI